jgi:hypothetical protein
LRVEREGRVHLRSRIEAGDRGVGVRDSTPSGIGKSARQSLQDRVAFGPACGGQAREVNCGLRHIRHREAGDGSVVERREDGQRIVLHEDLLSGGPEVEGAEVAEASPHVDGVDLGIDPQPLAASRDGIEVLSGGGLDQQARAEHTEGFHDDDRESIVGSPRGEQVLDLGVSAVHPDSEVRLVELCSGVNGGSSGGELIQSSADRECPDAPLQVEAERA